MFLPLPVFFAAEPLQGVITCNRSMGISNEIEPASYTKDKVFAAARLLVVEPLQGIITCNRSGASAVK